jgi:sRNA-binding protein
MPAKSPLSGTPPAAADDRTAALQDPESTPGSQDPDLTPVAGQQDTSDSGQAPSAAERLVAERTERRHQRMLARESSSATREPDTAERRTRPTGSSSALTPPKHQTLRNSLPVTVIAMLAAGVAVGAILGALSVAGWVIGLVVSGLTAILSTVLRPRSRST